MSQVRPDAGERPYTVVVGVSASSSSPTALRWAAGQVAANDGVLVAVRAWRVGAPQASTAGVMAASGPTERELESTERAALERDVEEALGPDHRAEVRLVRGSDRQVLLDAAAGADLIVVDAPRALTGAPLFAQRLIYDASCPVVLMPPQISGQGPGLVERAGRAVGRAAVRSAGTAGRPGYRPPARH